MELQYDLFVMKIFTKFTSLLKKKEKKSPEMKLKLKDKLEGFINLTQFKMNESLDNLRDFINQEDED